MPNKEFCIYCGMALEHNSDCSNPRCKPKERQFCEYCGNRCVQGVVFCMSCGEPFSEMKLDHSLLTKGNSDEVVNLFKVEDEELTRYIADDLEIDAVAQRKLPTMGVGAFLKNAIGQVASTAESEIGTKTSDNTEKKDMPMPSKPHKEPKHTKNLLDCVPMASEPHTHMINEDAVVAPAVAPDDVDANDMLAIFERDNKVTQAEKQTASKINISLAKSDTTVGVCCKTFIPKKVSVGSYVYTATPMSLVRKCKPIIPTSYTLGL